MATVYNEHTRAYGADDTVFFAVRTGDPWAPELAQAEQAIEGLDGVERTLSPFSMETPLR